MSKQKNGSAHVVIIAALVVIILGLLGFVFWQNFIDKKTDTSKTTTAKTETEESVEGSVEKPAEKMNLAIIFSAWNVGADYDTTKAEILFQAGTTGDSVNLLGAKLVNQGVSGYVCQYGDSGAITRYAASDIVAQTNQSAGEYFAAKPQSVTWKQVGDYYFMYRGSASTCTADMNQYELDAVASARQIVLNLEATK